MSACDLCARGLVSEAFAVGEACTYCGHVPLPVALPATPSPAVVIRPSLTLVAPPVASDTKGVVMSEPTPVVSPTGAPVLPAWVPGVAAALVGLAATLQQVLPPHTVGFQIAGIVVGIGAAFGIVSQGVRRK